MTGILNQVERMAASISKEDGNGMIFIEMEKAPDSDLVDASCGMAGTGLTLIYGVCQIIKKLIKETNADKNAIMEKIERGVDALFKEERMEKNNEPPEELVKLFAELDDRTKAMLRKLAERDDEE